jgi:hypothetical protein
MPKGRARTVISPPLPEKAKSEAPVAPPPEVKGWRSRPTRPGLTGHLERPFYGAEDEVRERAEVDEMTGAAPVVEQLRGSLYGRPPRDVPTVAELALEGMAREVTYTIRGADGVDRVQTRWEITALGQDVLTDAMLGRDE